MKFLCKKKIIDRILLGHFLTFKRNFINTLHAYPALYYRGLHKDNFYASFLLLVEIQKVFAFEKNAILFFKV